MDVTAERPERLVLDLSGRVSPGVAGARAPGETHKLLEAERPVILGRPAAWYYSATLAGMRPRSLTARPCCFAQARISPER
jgi:hypothetical protein